MRGRPRAVLRSAVAVLVGAALAGAPAVATASPSAPPPSSPSAPPAAGVADDGLDVAVALTSVTPGALQPDGELVVSGTLTSRRDEPLDDLRVRLRVERDRLDTRSALEAWESAPPERRRGELLRGTTTEVPEPLLPGRATSFALRASADAVGLPDRGSAWGPYGLSAEVVDARGRRVGVVRTFAVWLPESASFTPTGVSVLVPLVADGATTVPLDGPGARVDGLVPADRLAASTSRGGRLSDVLAAASGAGTTWAVDPALLASTAAALSDDGAVGDGAVGDGAATPSDAPSSAPSDAPPAGAATGAAGAPSAGASATSSPALPAAPSPEGGPPPSDGPTAVPDPESPVAAWSRALAAASASREVVALPYADVDPASSAHAGAVRVLEQATSGAEDAVGAALPGARVLASAAWPAGGWADAPSLDASARAGAEVVVLQDEAVGVDQDASSTPTGVVDVAAGGARLPAVAYDSRLSDALAAATTPAAAALVEQRLLADTAAITLQRPNDGRHVLVAAPRAWDPDPGGARSALRALGRVPWVERASLEQLLQVEAPGAVAVPVLPAQVAAEELPVAHVRAVTAARASVDDVARLSSAVRVLEGSPLNYLAARADVPVTVANDLDQPVEVLVSLRPSVPLLETPDPVPVEVAARSQQRVVVPTTARANGTTGVVAQVLSPTGEALGEPTRLQVRVRMDWEVRGLSALAAVLALLVLLGVVRSVRAGRRRRALEAAS